MKSLLNFIFHHQHQFSRCITESCVVWQRCAPRATYHAAVYSRVFRALGVTSSRSQVARRAFSVRAECELVSRVQQTSARVKGS